MSTQSTKMAVLFAGSLLIAADLRGATILVNTLADNQTVDGLCTLREAIIATSLNVPVDGCAAGSPNPDRIRFDVTGTIVLESRLPNILTSVAIEGPGRDLLTIDGDDQFGVLAFAPVSPTAVVVRDLSLARGFSSATYVGGGCLAAVGGFVALAVVDVTIRHCIAEDNGGGIYADGDLWLQRVWLDGNEAMGASGGGGAFALGVADVEVADSAFTGNFASGANAFGGGLRLGNDGTVRVTSTTFSGNRSNEFGGGLAARGVGTIAVNLAILDSTFVANGSDEDETSSQATGGTLYFFNSVTSQVHVEIGNSIFASGRDGASPTRCDEILIGAGDAPPVVESLGFNLLSDNGCVEGVFPESPGAGVPNEHGDFVGTTEDAIDPRLEVLAANGGPTPTHLPLQETPHPVVDQGGCPASRHDQRGLRGDASGYRSHNVDAVPDNPSGDGCDIGAVERGAGTPTRLLFVDGFEWATTLLWSAELL